MCLVELTVCFETSFNEAAERKQVKYQDLVERARRSNYRTTYNVGGWVKGNGEYGGIYAAKVGAEYK